MPSLGLSLLPGIFVDEEISLVYDSRYVEELESIMASKIVNNNAGSAGYECEVEEHISAVDLLYCGRLFI
ncbi:hypothetical protein N7452_003846 [Penicillium brevicompactum]|uniref:Uncharacterized protein n=1 Tax=Penicillium brevicompactum TaxID=5074 RepID=A0A9W9QUG7_PENBR|nr:hypothetical protein N7452_003846 [Penicillium brevicompactum]